jgi:uncharacterized OsmC-like protein
MAKPMKGLTVAIATAIAMVAVMLMAEELQAVEEVQVLVDSNVQIRFAN